MNKYLLSGIFSILTLITFLVIAVLLPIISSADTLGIILIYSVILSFVIVTVLKIKEDFKNFKLSKNFHKEPILIEWKYSKDEWEKIKNYQEPTNSKVYNLVIIAICIFFILQAYIVSDILGNYWLLILFILGIALFVGIKTYRNKSEKTLISL